jgi:hypothetical protein
MPAIGQARMKPYPILEGVGKKTAIDGRGRILISTCKTDPEAFFFDCNIEVSLLRS